MITEHNAVSAYPAEIPASSYATWLWAERMPTGFTAPAMMWWINDSSLAYGMWRAQNRESIYATQRIIAGWFQTGEPTNNRQRRGRNRKRVR